MKFFLRYPRQQRPVIRYMKIYHEINVETKKQQLNEVNIK